MLQPRLLNSKLIKINEVNPGMFHMAVEASLLAQNVMPGQFVMIQINETTVPLLRRPFSICGRGSSTVELLFQVVGAGTNIMSKWLPGHTVNMVGPLGKGFSISPKVETAFLLAGGIGIAPLLFLARKIRESNKNTDINIFMGGKSEKDVLWIENFNLQGCELFYSTENGRKGYKGLVTSLFSNYLSSNPSLLEKNRCIFGCGPMAMAQALADIAHAYAIPCQLSLESRMACGIGACMGCVVETKSQSVISENVDSNFCYKRVCVEGPVFDSREISYGKN